MPDTGGDPLGFLGDRVAAPRFEEKEMAVFVNCLAAEPEIPIDHLDRPVEYELAEPRFLADLAPRGLGRGLTGFEVALGESPVLVRVAYQQKSHLAVRPAPKDDAAGARFALGAGLGLAGLRSGTGHENSECEMRNAKLPGGASCLMSGHKLALTFRISHSHFRIPVLEDAEREILAWIRLDVGKQLPELNHGERRLAIQRRVGDEEPERAAPVRDARQDGIGVLQYAHEALLIPVCCRHQLAEVLRRTAEIGAGSSGVIKDSSELSLVGRGVHTAQRRLEIDRRP